jgi:hypothetical protein
MATFRATLMPYAAGLAAVLALTGCGDGKERTGAPGVSVPSTPSLTSSSGTTAPTGTAITAVDPALARIPPAARPNTRAGAEAFGRFFIEQVAQSGVEADPTLLDGLYAESCKTCGGLRAMADDLRRAGHHVEKPALRVKETDVASIARDAHLVTVGVHAGPFEIVDRGGSHVETRQEEDRFAFVLTMSFEDHWVVDLAQVELPE